MQQCMQLTRTNSSRSYVVRTLLSLCGSQGAGDDATAVPDRFPVVMARGIHLFPFRTESLSPSAPMVLGGKLPGRVGRRRNYLQKATPQGVAFCRSGCLRWAWPAAALVAAPATVAASPAGLHSGDVLPVGCCRPRGAFPQSQAVRGLRRAVVNRAAPAGVRPSGDRGARVRGSLARRAGRRRARVACCTPAGARPGRRRCRCA